MENAAKALIIAGGVLIAILLASLFTYLSRTMADSTEPFYSMMSDNEIAEFNQRFLKYEGRTDLTVQDVATIINLVKHYSNDLHEIKFEYNAFGSTQHNYTHSSTTGYKNGIEFLDDEVENADARYKCTEITIDPTSRLVKYISLQQIK